MSELILKKPIVTLSVVVTKPDGTIEDYGIVATSEINTPDQSNTSINPDGE